MAGSGYFAAVGQGAAAKVAPRCLLTASDCWKQPRVTTPPAADPSVYGVPVFALPKLRLTVQHFLYF
jgi:hypothetical protein